MSNFRLFLPIIYSPLRGVESSIISVFHFFILDSRSEKRRRDRLENEESVDFPLRRKPGSGEKRRRKFPPLSSVPFQSTPFSTIFFSPRTKQTEPNSKTLLFLGQPRQGARVSFSLISSFSLPHPFLLLLSNKFDYSIRKVYISYIYRKIKILDQGLGLFDEIQRKIHQQHFTSLLSISSVLERGDDHPLQHFPSSPIIVTISR